VNTRLIQRALEALPHLTDAEVVAMSTGRRVTTAMEIAATRKEVEVGLTAALAGKKNPVADLFFRRAKKFGIS
jgi:hypothetical protein